MKKLIIYYILLLSLGLYSQDYFKASKNIIKKIPFCITNNIKNNNECESRTFSKSMRKQKYKEQNGKCAHCGKTCYFNEMEGDHVIPWSKGGHTKYSNLQMLCRHCNRSKGNRYSY